MDISHSFCPIPWVHSSTDSYGHLRICCLGGSARLRRPDQTRYSAKTDTLPRNHKDYKDIRVEMLNGIRPTMCDMCWVMEDAGMDSNRVAANLYFYPDMMEKAVRLTSKDGEVDPNDFPIRYYDLRLGNHCNCKCIMCNSQNSSMWNGEVYDWSDQKLETPYLKELVRDLEHMDRLYLTGGEPTINEGNWKLVNMLIDKGYAKNVDLDYNTNGLYFKPWMVDKWKEFRHVGIGFSIDGMGKTLEKIRYPTKWLKISKNLDLYEKCATENMDASICMTIMTLNVLNVINFFKWWRARKFKTIVPIPHFNILSRPIELDIRRLDNKRKDEIKKIYEEFYIWLDNNGCENNHVLGEVKRNFKGIINAMYMEAPEIRL